MLLSLLVTVIALLTLVVLLAPRIRQHRAWQATVTPLASIIGSGFLVIAPLLHETAGVLAAPVMLVIVLLAAGLGSVVRFNIRYLESRLRQSSASALHRLERGGELCLLFAYVISIAFYLSLLSAFILRFLPAVTTSELNKDILTTAILVFIAVQGLRGGLSRLELLEEYSVSIKLAIIAALLVGLFVYFTQHPLTLAQLPPVPTEWGQRLRLIAGTLLVIQGFETSRYLGEAYDGETRCRSMAYAQWLSGAVYVLFICLVMPLLYANDTISISETAIIDLSYQVAFVLAPLLLLAAVMSQFSASIADTLGAGGLSNELSGHRLPSPIAYVLIASIAIVLVWISDVYQIISLASRAFALYYLVQCILALSLLREQLSDNRTRFLLTLGLTVVMGFVVIFARSVEASM